MLAPKEIAIAVTKALDEKKGMDITLLKTGKVQNGILNNSKNV